jgi:hypothetical protein
VWRIDSRVQSFLPNGLSEKTISVRESDSIEQDWSKERIVEINIGWRRWIFAPVLDDPNE